jgi:hypothetical protein
MRILTVPAATIVLAAAAAVALSCAPASAQGMKAPESKTPQQIADELKRREDAEVERQYEKRARTPAPEVQNDPWRNIRPSSGSTQQKR